MVTRRNFSFILLLVFGSHIASFAQEQPAPETLAQPKAGNHTELGITVGTPSILNLVVGRWWEQWGVRAIGMTYGANCRGIQLYAGYEFIHDKDHRHCIGLAGGTWHYSYNDWRFLGPAYDLYIGGFFMEFGIAWGKGSYMANQVLWQFGYSHSIF